MRRTAPVADDAELVREFTGTLADALARFADDSLLGVYVHGSAVLGDWRADVSDVDVLVVARSEVATATAERLAAVLSAERACPGVGLEATIVSADAAAAPAAPWPFVVHVTTAPHDRKTVWGKVADGDTDLILHYAVTRALGWTAVGLDPKTLIGPVADSIVLRQLADELRWGIRHASESYAILNACRALRFRDERVLCSKTDGGEWALARGIEPALVRRALHARRNGESSPAGANAAAWVTEVCSDLDPQ
jgi:Aminoglycoside adenylyltransferase, C-terminal domain/Nucleotidyltransferase domain